MDEAEPVDDIEKTLDEMNTRAFEFLNKGHDRTAVRIFGELQRKAKQERRLIHYVDSAFIQMNVNQNLFEPQLTQQYAIELIGILDNAERARVIQSDYPEDVYEYRGAWMTPCLYENLADAAGTMQGFNSEGMHACIGDGLQVCRRTGKLSCIRCFREYATDVYLAADDLFMALHQSNTILGQPAKEPEGWPDRGDRRWLGAKNVAKVLLLQGQLDGAEASLLQAGELCSGEHVVHQDMSRLRLALSTQTVRLLAGTADVAKPFVFPLPANENPYYELRWGRAEALRHACAREFDAAQDLLANWDRRLQKNCLSDWFEVRLRLVALCRIAGQDDKIEALTNPLVERAKKARDWLTLHRLGRLLDPGETPSPLALLGPLTGGPFAAPATQETVPEAPPADATPEAAAESAEPPPTPFQEFIGSLFQRLQDAGDDATKLNELCADILAVEPAKLTEPNDTAWLMYLLLCSTGPESRLEDTWNWIEAVAAPHPQHPSILNLRASMGDLLRGLPDSPLAERISLEDIDHGFRQSLDLDPFNPRAHARAGDFFFRQGNLGEAERCLARGFRLVRDHAFLAQKLAEVYDQTERPRDALAVLDLCLREGCQVSDIAWQAALKAHLLEQYESLLTYINRFDELAPDQPWANYYRALGLLETNQPQEALKALDNEERIIPEHAFPVAVLRASAHAALNNEEASREQVEKVLTLPLVEVDYMTFQGLSNMFSRLWKAAAAWPEDDPLRERLTTRMLHAGLAPDDAFEPARQRNEKAEDLKHYRCTIRQELDESWPEFDGCLAHQTEWESFQQMWGALAPDEEDAARQVTEWHGRTFPTGFEVVNCEMLADNFTDKPGIVWQGERWNEEPAEES